MYAFGFYRKLLGYFVGYFCQRLGGGKTYADRNARPAGNGSFYLLAILLQVVVFKTIEL
jgi:hypothetical protein